jgi:hypothetical protein
MRYWIPSFRLRTFLVLVGIVCVLLGWRVWDTERVERPIRQLEQLGWHVSYHREIIAFYNPGGPVLERVVPRPYWQKLLLGYRRQDLPDAVYVTDQMEHAPPADLEQLVEASVAPLNQLPSVREVVLSNSNVTRECLSHLGRLTHLRLLDFGYTPLGDDALAPLIAFDQLEKLCLWGTAFSSQAIDELSKWLPSCEIQSDW